MNTQRGNTQSNKLQPTTQTARYNKGRPVKILLDATHVFCRFDRPEHSEIRKYKELFYSLIEQTSLTEKREISITLARNNYTPRSVAIHLALGEVSGSTPILLFSPVLKDADLFAIAQKSPVSGIRVLARRDGLSLRVMKAIDERGDAMASRIIRSESGSAIKPTPVTPMKTPTLEAPLAKTEAMPGEATPVDPQQELMALASRGGRMGKDRSEVSTVFSDPSDGIAESLIHAARNRDKDTFCLIVGNATSLNTQFIEKLLSESNPEMLCALLKALHIPNSGASQILLLLNREIGTSVQLFRAVMAKYDQLVQEQCREELSRMGAQFKGNTPGYQSTQSHIARLESALRTRQQALGQQTHRPSFGRKPPKQVSVA